MGQSRIPVRYAKALFSLAMEKNMLDVFRSDMDLVSASCETKEFKSFLESPVITTSKKEAVISEIFKASVHEKTLAFLMLILKNKRETYLPDVARNFIDLYREQKGIKSVKFTSAVALDKNLKASIIATIKKFYASEIELKDVVDSDIIGGVILKVDDRQNDASISSKLKKIKRSLTGSTIGNIDKN
jgi:F-type H+-transporting ATPase subunit delta